MVFYIKKIKLRAFETVDMRIRGSKWKDLTGRWRKLHDDELHNL